MRQEKINSGNQADVRETNRFEIYAHEYNITYQIVCVDVTNKGREISMVVFNLINEVYATTTKKFSEEEKKKLNEYIVRINKNVGHFLQSL